MPPRFFSMSCEVTAIISRRLMCWPSSHPCQRLGAWAAACQVSPGRSPGWRAKVAVLEPSFCQARQGGHLWSLRWHLAPLCSKVPPWCQAPTQLQSIIWIFPSVNYFWILPSGPVIMMLRFEMSARHSEYSWPSSLGAVAGEVLPDTCHHPCFVLSRKTHVPPDNL